MAYRRAAATGGNGAALQDLIQLVSLNLGALSVRLSLPRPVAVLHGRVVAGEETIEPISLDGDTLSFGDLPTDRPLTLLVEGTGLQSTEQVVEPVAAGERRALTLAPAWVGLGTVAIGAFQVSSTRVSVGSAAWAEPGVPGTDVSVTAGMVTVAVENSLGRIQTQVEVPPGSRILVDPARYAPAAVRVAGIPAGSRVRMVVESMGEGVLELVRDLPAAEGVFDLRTGVRVAPPQEFRPVPGGNGGLFVTHPVLGKGTANLILLAGTENSLSFPVANMSGLPAVEASYARWRAREAAALAKRTRAVVLGVAGGSLAGVAAGLFTGAAVANTKVGPARDDALAAPAGAGGDAAVDEAWGRFTAGRRDRLGLGIAGAVLGGLSMVAFGLTFGQGAQARGAIMALGVWDPQVAP